MPAKNLALLSTTAAFSTERGWTTVTERVFVRQEQSGDEVPRIGEYRVDYMMPSREEIDAYDNELADLLANSKVISVKGET